MEGNRRNFEYYDGRAQDVNLDDITSSSRNAQILRDLRDGNTAWKGAHLQVWGLNVVRELYPDEDESDDDYFGDFIDTVGNQVRRFTIRDGDDLGWLGYFMRNVRVKDLSIYTTPVCGEQVHEMMGGIKNNRLIERIFIRGIHSNYFMESLTSIIINSSNLKKLEVYYSDDVGYILALALAERRNKSSLTHLRLVDNNLSNEELIEITSALSEYSNMEHFHVDEIQRDSNYYDILAPFIDLRSITSSPRNAEILRKLRDGVPIPGCRAERGVLYVVDYECEVENHFAIIKYQDDCGWLGYFLGKSEELQQLNLYCLPEEGYEIDAFMEGFKLNQSIEDLDIRLGGVQGDVIIDSLSTFVINTSSLRSLRLWYVDIGLECASSLALALDQRPDKSSLTRFSLSQNNLGDDGLVEIATALCAYPQVHSLGVQNNSIGSVGCESLGALFGSRANSNDLKELILTENAIDDAVLQTLVPGLITSCVGLKKLCLSGNRAITAAGLRCLAGLFQSGNCCLESLYLDKMRIGDDGSEALAFGLTGNTSLKHLVISPESAEITEVGWSVFSKLLCDTSSLSNTYLSNHTLEHIGDNFYYTSGPDGLVPSVVLHSDRDEPFRGIPIHVGNHLFENRAPPCDAARFKIFTHHPDMNVETLFEYGLKLLPHVVSGFEWTREYSCNNEYWDWEDEDSYFYFERRRLSSVYKFIRGMPLLVVDGYWGSKWGSCQRCGRKRKFLEE
ncbi:hypothetical protein ACHAWC_006461 [Mediolabrus comicus]